MVVETLVKTHPAWRSTFMIGRVVAAVISTIFLSALVIFLGSQDILGTGWVILGVLLVIALNFGTVYLIRSSRLYMITRTGVIVETGFPIRTQRSSMSFSKIQVVDVRQTILEKLVLKTGTVDVDTAAEAEEFQQKIQFQGVSNPHRLAEMIRQGEEAGTKITWEMPNSHLPSWEQPHQTTPPWGQPPQAPPQSPQAPPAPNPWDQTPPGGHPPNPWDR